MTRHGYKIQVISTPEDLEQWTAAQYSSFVGTGCKLHEVLSPPAAAPTQAQLKMAAARHVAALEDDPEHNFFIRIVDPTNGAVMGGAKWEFWPHDPRRPLTVSVDYIDELIPAGKEERAFAQKVMDALLSRRVRDMGTAHGLLDICYTVSKYERKGVASALVSWGLKILDEKGWIAFTEASSRGEPVYARLGFEQKEVVR